MTTDGYEIVEHTADWSIRVYGRDLEELLIHAARGMSSLLVPDLEAIATGQERQFELDAYDAEGLLVEWLSELAYWAEMEQLVFSQFDLWQVTPTHLKAAVRGGRAPEMLKHIKAVTYHNLDIIQTDEGLEATIVFDV
jgi:SHS2 domain-containing protein